jgi:hypothetical protein
MKRLLLLFFCSSLTAIDQEITRENHISLSKSDVEHSIKHSHVIKKLEDRQLKLEDENNKLKITSRIAIAASVVSVAISIAAYISSGD